MKFLLFILISASFIFSLDSLEILVKGFSNQENNGHQIDRQEAILDAKRQACEKAGIIIESKTTSENFQLLLDLVETKSNTILLPDFKIMDIGYNSDSCYQVVLSGKITLVQNTESTSSKEIRHIHSLHKNGDHRKCKKLLKKYFTSSDKSIKNNLKEEAFYLYIRWGYAINYNTSLTEFIDYYPNSNYIDSLKSFGEFITNFIFEHDTSITIQKDSWQEANFIYNKKTYSKTVEALIDTIVYTNYNNTEHSIIIDYTLYSDNNKYPLSAFSLTARYFDSNIKTNKISKDGQLVLNLFQSFKTYKKKFFRKSRENTVTISYDRSSKKFNNFLIESLIVNGDVPRGKGPFKYSIKYNVKQIAF